MVLQTPPPLNDIDDAAMHRNSRAVVMRSGSDGIRAAAPARRSNGVCAAGHTGFASDRAERCPFRR